MAYATINKPNLHFNTVTWTGDSTTPKTITGVGFQPDLIWGKDRSMAYSHQLFDAVRGFGSEKELTANATLAEGGQNADVYGYLSGVTADGFTTVKGSDAAGYDYWNESPDNYVAWNWKANGAGISNTAGTISSTVSANTTNGFSIVSWTGTGSNSDQTLGTGLSTALDFVIAKPRDSGGGTDSWLVYTSAISLGQSQCYLLDQNSALISGATNGTPNRGSTAGQLKLYAGSSGNQNLNASGLKYIAYCFHSVKGFSKFGSYVGNGSTDGTFVYTGFKPAMVIAKASSTTGQWSICDNRRGTANTANGEFLFAESSEALNAATNNWDFLSNGFKARANYAAHNTSGVTYIYMAFAENPLVGTNNVPATAR